MTIKVVEIKRKIMFTRAQFIESICSSVVLAICILSPLILRFLFLCFLCFLKVLLFHLSGHGNHHDDATLNFISDSSGCMLGLSNEISFVSGFFLEGGQNSQNVNLEIRGCISFFRRLYLLMPAKGNKIQVGTWQIRTCIDFRG